jgi:hypothetical protein
MIAVASIVFGFAALVWEFGLPGAAVGALLIALLLAAMPR